LNRGPSTAAPTDYRIRSILRSALAGCGWGKLLRVRARDDARARQSSRSCSAL